MGGLRATDGWPGIGCVRAAEIALKALDHELDRTRLRELEKKLAQLEKKREDWELPDE